MLQTACVETPYGPKVVLYSSIYYSSSENKDMPYESFSPRIPPPLPGIPRRSSSSLSSCSARGDPIEAKKLKAGAVAVLVTDSGK